MFTLRPILVHEYHRLGYNCAVTQQARHMTWALEDRALLMRYLIHDHDTKFTGLFDTVFESAGIEIVNIPFEAPNANAFPER